jgi:hypothetical protein
MEAEGYLNQDANQVAYVAAPTLDAALRIVSMSGAMPITKIEQLTDWLVYDDSDLASDFASRPCHNCGSRLRSLACHICGFPIDDPATEMPVIDGSAGGT